MFKRISKGFNKYALYPKSESTYDIIDNNGGRSRDFYESVYTYQEKHYNKFITGLQDVCQEVGVEYNSTKLIDTWGYANSAINKLLNNGDISSKEADELKAKFSLAGTTDIKTNRLVFDFDHKDVTEAKKDTQRCLAKLYTAGFQKENILCCFSGNKGFSVEVILDEYITRKEFENITQQISNDLETFDPVCKDEQRIFRVPLTKHAGSGLYKVPLSLDHLEKFDLDTIKESASTKQAKSNMGGYQSWVEMFGRNETPIPESIRNSMKMTAEEKNTLKQSTTAETFINFDEKPPWLSKWKYALQQGFFEEGSRNTSFMVLASTYRNQGFQKEVALFMLKAVADIQAQRNNCEPYPENQLQSEIIDVVYSKTWGKGQYTDDCGLAVETNKKLQDLGYDVSEKNHNLLSIEEVKDRFVGYAETFSESRVKIGIKELDDKLVITAGMLVSVLGAPGGGKCLAKDTPVLMYNGSIKLVQDIVVGDKIMGPDSKPRTVGKLGRGREEMFDIIPIKGGKHTVNRSHILSVVMSKRAEGHEAGDIVDLSVDEYLKRGKNFRECAKLYRTGVNFQQQPIYLDPYVLGVWLGDGTTGKPQITMTDSEVKNYVQNYLCVQNNMDMKLYGENKIEYDFTGNGCNFLINHLKHLEVYKNKHIPNRYKVNDREVRLQLLAGLLDTDGYLHNNYYEIVTKHDKMKDGILFLARSLGFAAYSSVKSVKLEGWESPRNYHRITISGHVDEIPCKVARKKAVPRKQIKDVLRTGFTVESLGEGDYYGFELVEEPHFLLGDFTVTHNTSLIKGFMKSMSKNGQGGLFECLDMTDPFMFARLTQEYCNYSFAQMCEIIAPDSIEPEDRKFDEVTDEMREGLFADMAKAMEDYKHVTFQFDSGTSIEDIRDHIIKYRALKGDYPKVVFVDYLEKVRGPYSDDTANSGFVAARLQDLAREFKCVVFLLVQPQKHAGDPNEPIMSMRKIKGSSKIEQDSRVVLTLWRPMMKVDDPKLDKYMSVAIVKNNLGQLGKFDFMWDGLTGQIRSMTPDERNQYELVLQRIQDEKQAEEEERKKGWWKGNDDEI